MSNNSDVEDVGGLAESFDTGMKLSGASIEDGAIAKSDDTLKENDSGSGSSGNDSGIEEITLSMTVRASAVGLLIGKSGQTLNIMTTQSGASIKFHELGEVSILNQKERCVVISGRPKSVNEAFKMVMIRLQSQLSSSVKSTSEDKQDTHLIQWAIPQAAAGLLIGKQGAGIKHINEKSGCWVKIAHPEESLVSGERIVYIRGYKNQTQMALEIVKKVAGGRSIIDDDKEAFCIKMRVPRRATEVVLRGFINEEDESLSDVDYFMEEFASVRVRIDSFTFTGLSEVLVNISCEDPILRAEAVKIVESRLATWEKAYVSPQITPRTETTSDSNVVTDHENDASLHLEMSVVLLVSVAANEKVIFPKTVGQPDANIFNDYLVRYGCTMSKFLNEGQSNSPRDRLKRLLVTGSLRSLSRCVVKIVEKIHKRHPEMVVVLEDPNKAKQNRSMRGGGGRYDRTDSSGGGYRSHSGEARVGGHRGPDALKAGGMWQRGLGDRRSRSHDLITDGRNRYHQHAFRGPSLDATSTMDPMQLQNLAGTVPSGKKASVGDYGNTQQYPGAEMYGNAVGSGPPAMMEQRDYPVSNTGQLLTGQSPLNSPASSQYFVSPPGSPMSHAMYQTGAQDRPLYYYLAEQQQAQLGAFYFPVAPTNNHSDEGGKEKER